MLLLDLEENLMKSCLLSAQYLGNGDNLFFQPKPPNGYAIQGLVLPQNRLFNQEPF